MFMDLSNMTQYCEMLVLRNKSSSKSPTRVWLSSVPGYRAPIANYNESLFYFTDYRQAYFNRFVSIDSQKSQQTFDNYAIKYVWVHQSLSVNK